MEGPRYCSWAPDRLLRDPATRRMNAEAFGGYCSLLIEAWLDPTGTLPTDREELAVLARMTKATWARHERTILGLFETQDDRLTSPIIEEAREKILRKSANGRRAVEARETRKAEKFGKVEPKPASNDDRTMIERLSKEKEKEKEKEKPPSPPSGGGAAKVSRKALAKGDPENSETWARFDAAYPRPLNGRKLERGEARLIWDLLVADGEDVEAIITAAERYRDWITALGKGDYVAMMTTWLNQRRFEESYVIDPTSEDAKKIAAAKDAELRERRSAHQAEFGKDYDRYVVEIAEAGITDPEFVARWQAQAEATLAKRERMGLAGAVRIARAVLEDPDERHQDQRRMWLEENRASIPTFWDWDTNTNPRRFKE